MADNNAENVDKIEATQQKSKEEWEAPRLDILHLPEITQSGASADSESNDGLFS